MGLEHRLEIGLLAQRPPADWGEPVSKEAFWPGMVILAIIVTYLVMKQKG
jgi:hypothetical protein